MGLGHCTLLWTALVAMLVVVPTPSAQAQVAKTSRSPKSSSKTPTAVRGALSASSTSRGAYTPVQAGRGERLYRANCASCHAATAYTGASFAQLWVGRTAYDMVSLLRQTMPNDDPGRLTKQQYVDIVAYLFRLNGYPSGSRALPTDDPALKKVRIDARGGVSDR